MSLFTIVLTIALVIAVLATILSAIGVIIHWKPPRRRGHVIRLLLALLAVPCIYGVHFAHLYLIVLPEIGRQQREKFNARRAEQIAATTRIHIGDMAPPFSLNTVDGVEFCLPKNGKVVLINFFATWCGPCRVELPHIERIWTTHKDNEDFRLLVIGREETTETVLQYSKENGFSFPIAADPDREVYSLFADELIPRTVIVSRDGRVVYSHAGFDEDDGDELYTVLQQQLSTH